MDSERLISAERLVINLAKKNRFGRIEYDDIMAVIADAPTVDAVEVVHGRWILKSRIYKMFDDVDEEFYVECNLCNREEPVCFEFGEQQMLDYAKRHYPYCHCGAKMDGGNEDG